jgi:hypothetical protein
MLSEGRTFLATQAKGIYKPEWSRFALCVRQTLGGPYADREPVRRSDGTWVYEYFQENPDPRQRDAEFTNVALMECLRSHVPVAVLRQTKAKPGVRYLVLGLAIVSAWDAGYFFLEGFGDNGIAHDRGPLSELDVVANDSATAEVDVPSAIDARKKVLAQVVQRRGQTKFRGELLSAYYGRCCISGCDVTDALEAAHISPYNGPQTNHVTNGLLLRADLHTLFDLGLLTISGAMRVVLAPRLRDTAYGEFHGRTLTLPTTAAMRPNTVLLAEHREFSGISES